MLYNHTFFASSRLVLGSFIILASSARLEAKPLTSVVFDASSAIACRVVTPPSPVGARSGGKLIEAKFRVSILVDEGRPENVEDVVILLESPGCRLRVIDFFPKTEMADAVQGEVQTTHTTEKTLTAGAQIGGTAIPIFTPASASVGGMHHQVVAQTFKELPSKCLVLASGTTNSEHGVFFKVKGSPQVPLEGAKEFTCVFEVPKDWRGDWCLLTCHARSVNERNKKFEPCGRAQVFVGMYLAGDEQGQRVARRLERLQSRNTANQPGFGASADEEQAAGGSSRHKTVRATLAGWARLPRLFDHSSNRNAAGANQDAVALRRTLDELSGMAGH
jgi:hypothetical protein